MPRKKTSSSKGPKEEKWEELEMETEMESLPSSTPTADAAMKSSATPAPAAEKPDFTPLKLSEAASTSLVSLLESLHSRAMNDISKLTDKWKLWRDLYDGSIVIDPVTKAWTDASEIFFPLVLMIADTARARLLQSYFQQRDVAAIEAVIKDSEYLTLTGENLHDDISAARRFINHVAMAEDELNMKEAMDSAFGEETQVGTTAIKVFHDYRRAKKKQRDLRGKISKGVVVITDRIRIKVIPLEQCFWDTTADEPLDLGFFGYDFTLNSVEFVNRAVEMGWTKEMIEEVLRNPDSSIDSTSSDRSNREMLTMGSQLVEVRMPDNSTYPVDPFARFSFREVWMANQDIDVDGVLEDSVIFWHPKSGKVSAQLYPYIHNQMAISLGHYERRRNRCIGKPPAASIETLASGVNAIANQAIDAQTIRNVPTILGPEGNDSIETLKAQGFSPGQVLTYQTDPREITTLEFAGASNTVVSMEIFKYLLEIAFRVNHLGRGGFGDMAQAQRVTGDVGQAIMSESYELLDRINAHNRRLGSRILSQAFALYWQCQPSKFAQVLGPDDAKRVERLITTTGLDKLKISLNISSAISSRELDRQNNLSMGQFLAGTLRQFIELVDRISGGVDPKTGQKIPPNPATAEAATLVVKSMQEWLKRSIEAFPQVTDSSPYVPDITGLLERIKKQGEEEKAKAAQMEAAAGGMGGGMGGPGGGGVPLGPSTVQNPGFPQVGIGPGAGSLLGG